MSKLRLLPVVAIAAGGLLAAKALAGAEALPNLLGGPGPGGPAGCRRRSGFVEG